MKRSLLRGWSKRSRELRYSVSNGKGLTYFTSNAHKACVVGSDWSKRNTKVTVKVRKTGRIIARWVDSARTK